jgi:hypothetical protein
MPIPIVFFPGFPTWGFHSHFVKVRYTTRGHIGRNVVCSSSLSRSSAYSSNPPYLCFPFFNGWYTYSRSYIKCGSCIFTITRGIISNGFLSATNKVCILVSLRIGPFYITSSWLFYSDSSFSYFGSPMGSISFVESFVANPFHEDFRLIFSLPMLVDL